MNAGAGPAIALEGVSVVYGPRARSEAPEIAAMVRAGAPSAEITARTGCTVGLWDATLAVPGGGLFVIMGLSGSGKSTLLRAINRLVEPIAGVVRLGDVDVRSLTAAQLQDLRRTTVSMVFQHFGLLPHRNTLDNVAFPLRVQGRPAPEARRAAGAWLERLGLEAHANAAVGELSAGMRQRVGLARALVTGAPVLLMDEPFAALDPITRRKVQDELKSLQRELRKTVVLITHDPQEAFRLADTLAILRDGRVVQSGAPGALRAGPANDHVAALLAMA